jgi:hypothetical protein
MQNSTFFKPFLFQVTSSQYLFRHPPFLFVKGIDTLLSSNVFTPNPMVFIYKICNKCSHAIVLSKSFLLSADLKILFFLTSLQHFNKENCFFCVYLFRSYYFMAESAMVGEQTLFIRVCDFLQFLFSFPRPPFKLHTCNQGKREQRLRVQSIHRIPRECNRSKAGKTLRT